MQFAPPTVYPLIGLLLSAGAPIGSFLIRFHAMPSVRGHPLGDLHAHAFFYLYELVATSLVFGIAGFFAGRHADRLRRGEAFYHHLAEHDPLTGLHNARAFMDRYQRARERAASGSDSTAILLIDVDKLKEINDVFGHEAGNQALIQVADALRASKRAADVAARWGWDEFAILLEGADQAAALRIAEGIMGHLREGPSRLERGTVSVTIGICVMARPSLSFDLFAAADRALLAGKARGRNRIEMVSIGSFVSPRA